MAVPPAHAGTASQGSTMEHIYRLAEPRPWPAVSWTCSADVAARFANGQPGYQPPAEFVPHRGFVAEGLIQPANILAYFDDWRQESECVVDPGDVFEIQITEWDDERRAAPGGKP